MTLMTSTALQILRQWPDELAREGFAVLGGADVRRMVPAAARAGFLDLWEDLAPDSELCDGGCYRFRRYGRLRVSGEGGGWDFAALPHAPFGQDATYLPGYQGRRRLFGAIPDDVLVSPAITGLVAVDLAVAAALTSATRWIVGLHMVRVVAEPDAPGQPTPEGRHRDGHDYIGMHLMGRRGCSGGESVVYREGRPPVRLTLTESLDSLVVVDAALTHEVTAIAAGARGGIRDTLLIDLNIDNDDE